MVRRFLLKVKTVPNINAATFVIGHDIDNDSYMLQIKGKQKEKNIQKQRLKSVKREKKRSKGGQKVSIGKKVKQEEQKKNREVESRTWTMSYITYESAKPSLSD